MCWSLQVSHGVLDSTFYHSIPSHVKTLHDTLDKYEVTNPYGLFRRYLFVLISKYRLLVSRRIWVWVWSGDLGSRIWVHDCEIVYVHVCTIFLRSDAAANIFRCLILCGYYLRAVFISLESLQTSTMAG